jgi:hypothetical protein
MGAEIKLFVLHIDLDYLVTPEHDISKSVKDTDAPKREKLISDCLPKVPL